MSTLPLRRRNARCGVKGGSDRADYAGGRQDRGPADTLGRNLPQPDSCSGVGTHLDRKRCLGNDCRLGLGPKIMHSTRGRRLRSDWESALVSPPAMPNHVKHCRDKLWLVCHLCGRRVQRASDGRPIAYPSVGKS
jgi:hypothetical protein